MLKTIHDIVLGVLFTATLIVGGLYANEKYSDFDDYIEYYANIPAEELFIDEQIFMFSFAVTHEPLDMSFYNALICDYGDGNEVVDARLFEAQGFSFNHDLPQDVKDMTLNDLVFHEKKVVQRLRSYAKESGYIPWSLRELIPEKNGTCIDEARISLKTPMFGMVKEKGVTSAQFKYKIAP